MKNTNNILMQYLATVLKAAPWVITCMVVMISIAKLYIKYATPLYQSTAKLKIDEGTAGISKSNLYKDFDLFTAPNEVMTEIEVIKSTGLIKKTLEVLNFNVEYYQVGKIKTTELYERSPFKIDFLKNGREIEEKEVELTLDGGRIVINDSNHYHLNDTISLFDADFIISLNQSLLDQHKSIKRNGKFKFVLRNRSKLAKQIKKALDITAVDKDISVVRVSFKHQIPKKTTDFVNTHVKTYIKDYIENRTNAANKSLRFLENQLNEVSNKLIRDETKLEQYRLNNNIINTKQETETGIRKIAQLNIQLSNMEMKKAALDSLDIYINSGSKNFLELAPHFEVFGDMLYVELIKKIQGYRATRKELLINYTIHSEEIKTLDSKLEDLIAYFKESVKNSRQNIQTQKFQIELAIKKSEEEFKNTPTIEKNLTALKREFEQTQKLYTFLSEKKSEASLAQSASYSFHQVIEIAETPKKPTSPNKTLITFLCGFLGILIGVGLFYLKGLLFGNTIKTKEEIEKNFSDESFIIKDSNYQELTAKLLLKNKLEKNKVLLTTTIGSKADGLVHFEGVGDALAKIGRHILMLNFDFNNDWNVGQSEMNLHEIILEQKDLSQFHKKYKIGMNIISTQKIVDTLTVINHAHLASILESSKQIYDTILIYAPNMLTSMEAITLSKQANHTICFTKSNNVNIDACTSLDILKKEYNLNSLSIALEK